MDSDAIATLVAITGCPTEQAQFFLQSAGGNLELAASAYFAAQEGGAMDVGGGASGAGGAVGGGESSGGSDDDMEDDGFDASLAGLLPAAQSASAPPPPSKRAKVEERPPPELGALDAAAGGVLQKVFGLPSAPQDGGANLHKTIRARVQSWASGENRGLAYLLQCWQRLPAPGAADGADGAGFARECVLHHARTSLLSGDGADDSLALFEEGGDESEVAALLSKSGAAGGAFLAEVNGSMSHAEVEQVYGPMLDAVLRKLDPAAPNGATIRVGATRQADASADWRAVLGEAEALLGLSDAGGGALKPLAHGAAARGMLARRMADEATKLRSGAWTARDADGVGVLRIFAIAPAGLDPARQGARRNAAVAGHHEDESVLGPARDEVWAMQSRLRQLFTAALLKSSETRGPALDWTAAVLASNASANSSNNPPNAHPLAAAMRASSPACLVNLSAVLLQLCEPFLAPSAARNGKGHDGYTRLDPRWFARENHRAAAAAAEAARSPARRRRAPPTPAREPTLRQDVSERDERGAADPENSSARGAEFGMDAEEAEEADELAQAIRLSLDAGGSPDGAPAPSAGASAGSASANSGAEFVEEMHFVTECFFLAMRAMHVGLVPMMTRSERLTAELGRKAKQPSMAGQPSHAIEASLAAIVEARLGPVLATVLAHRVFVETRQVQILAGRYALLVAGWLQHLSDAGGDDLGRAASLLPEYCISDTCTLVGLGARAKADWLTTSGIGGPLVSRFLCGWLGRREVVHSPFVRYSMAEVLHSLVSTDELYARASGGRGGFGPELMSLVDGDAAQSVQVPLISLYVELGMHTNAAAVTDKNGQRYTIMRVLRALWEIPRVWAALEALAAASAGTANGPAAASSAAAAPAVSKADADAFGAFAETLVKEAVFLLNDALGRLTDVHSRQREMEDAEAWAEQPASVRREREQRLEQVKRTARGFLDLAKASLSALLFLTSDAAVAKTFAAAPDRAKKLASMLGKFVGMLAGENTQSLRVKNPEKLGWHPKEMLTNTAELLLHCTAAHPGFARVLGECDTFDLATLRKATSILGSKCNFPPLKLAELGELNAALGAKAAGAETGGAASVSGQAAADAASASRGLGPSELLNAVNAEYSAEVGPMAFDELDMEAPNGGYAHYYHQRIAEAPQGGAAKGKLKRLLQELGSLSGEGSLPVAPEGAVLMLRDESRMDVLKVLISGPAGVLDAAQDTPYAFGLFEFAVFIPPDYPNEPPLVNLQTTGDGMVRFNPNLYSDGKVCLSLLGTWHGEGWVAPSAGQAGSTILQVLISIQSIIMVPKPYFNEPGYAEEQGTPAGEARSQEYSENIRVATMRHAMRDMLRHPPAGFEEQVRAHFRTVRPLLLRNLARWLDEASTPSARVQLERAYTELKPLLDGLGPSPAEAPEAGGEA